MRIKKSQRTTTTLFSEDEVKYKLVSYEMQGVSSGYSVFSRSPLTYTQVTGDFRWVSVGVVVGPFMVALGPDPPAGPTSAAPLTGRPQVDHQSDKMFLIQMCWMWRSCCAMVGLSLFYTNSSLELLIGTKPGSRVGSAQRKTSLELGETTARCSYTKG